MEEKIYCSRCGKELVGWPYSETAGSKKPLCEKCSKKYKAELDKFENGFVGVPEFEEAAKLILKGLQKMGMPYDEANFRDTPKRLARAYYEIFEGVENTDEKVEAILSTSFPSEGHNDMVIASNVVAFSMCPHHLLPVEYRVCVAYIPKKEGLVLGLSKLARLVKLLAKQPALQETYTQQIADKLMKGIDAEGVAVRVVGRHMCMRMRGVQSPESSVTTSAVRGVFFDDSSCREEFMSLAEKEIQF